MVRAIFSTVHGKSNFWGKGVRGEGNVHGKSNMRKMGYADRQHALDGTDQSPALAQNTNILSCSNREWRLHGKKFKNRRNLWI